MFLQPPVSLFSSQIHLDPVMNLYLYVHFDVHVYMRTFECSVAWFPGALGARCSVFVFVAGFVFVFLSVFVSIFSSEPGPGRPVQYGSDPRCTPGPPAMLCMPANPPLAAPTPPPPPPPTFSSSPPSHPSSHHIPPPSPSSPSLRR